MCVHLATPVYYIFERSIAVEIILKTPCKHIVVFSGLKKKKYYLCTIKAIYILVLLLNAP